MHYGTRWTSFSSKCFTLRTK